MKTFSELDHMRLYRQTLMVPFDEKNKKKGTVVHLVGTDYMQAEAVIQNPIMKNPNLIEGYYIDKSIAHLINEEEETVKEETIEEAGIGAGMAAGYISKLALDVALKYSKKYIDAREAKTPTQKATAAKVFMVEYKRGKKAFEKFKSRDGNRALKDTTPDAWWISWFGIDSKDIKAIGTNERNKVKNTKFYNMVKEARGSTKIAANYVDEFDKFLEKKDFYLISSGVEDNGKVIPFKVEYFYCPQVDKIFNCSVLNGIINIDYKHPISISDYLNRSKVSMLEIKDVLKICKENEKETKNESAIQEGFFKKEVHEANMSKLDNGCIALLYSSNFSNIRKELNNYLEKSKFDDVYIVSAWAFDTVNFKLEIVKDALDDPNDETAKEFFNLLKPYEKKILNAYESSLKTEDPETHKTDDTEFYTEWIKAEYEAACKLSKKINKLVALKVSGLDKIIALDKINCPYITLEYKEARKIASKNNNKII